DDAFRAPPPGPPLPWPPTGWLCRARGRIARPTAQRAHRDAARGLLPLLLLLVLDRFDRTDCHRLDFGRCIAIEYDLEPECIPFHSGQVSLNEPVGRTTG